MINFFQKNNMVSYLVKFSAWLFLFLAVLEIFTRVFILKFPFQHLVPGLGLVPVDNAITVWGVEGYGVTQYLSNGEIQTPYESGASVVVLGDSYTEALHVNNDQKFVSVAETILHERGVEMDLHNLGASGNSLADYVYMAPYINKTYSPAIIVVQVAPADFEESFDKSNENYFVYSGDSLDIARNENHYLADLNTRNMLRITGLGSLLRYKLSPVIQEQRLRLASAGQPNADVQGEVSDKLNAADVKLQIDILEDAYPNSTVVFFIIPRVPNSEGVDLVWNNESDNLLIEAMNESSDLFLLYPHDEFVELYNTYRKFPRGFFNTLPNRGHLNSDGNYVLGLSLANYLEGIIK